MGYIVRGREGLEDAMKDRGQSKMKYRCIKELWLQKYDGDGFEIPNDYGCVEVGSIWERDGGTIILGGDIHLEAVSGGGNLGWIEVSTDTLEKYFVPEV